MHCVGVYVNNGRRCQDRETPAAALPDTTICMRYKYTRNSPSLTQQILLTTFPNRLNDNLFLYILIKYDSVRGT